RCDWRFSMIRTTSLSCVLTLAGVILAGCTPDSESASSPPETSASAKPATAPAPNDAPSKKPGPLDWTRLMPDALAEGWISLFDGTTLYGWTKSAKTDWRVENGTIVAESGDKGLLCTTSQFAD